MEETGTEVLEKPKSLTRPEDMQGGEQKSFDVSAQIERSNARGDVRHEFARRISQ